MTRRYTRSVVFVVLLVGLIGGGIRSGAGQDATPAQSATPALTPIGPECAGAGFAPVFQAVLDIAPGADGTVSAEILDRTREIVARRAAAFSPEGCAVWIDANGRLLVQLAVVADIDAVIQTLTGAARLEIVDTDGTYPIVGEVVETRPGAAAAPGMASTPVPGAFAVVLSGADVVDAFLTQGSGVEIQVAVVLTDEAATRFATFTAEHIGEPLAIVVDGEVISVPVIQAEISGGEIVIQGNFSLAESETLAFQFQSGALPAPLTLIETWTLTPTPGPTTLGGEVIGVESFTIESAQHSTEPVVYAQSPPVGGMHDPVWQTRGFYDAPVRNENAVHALEHGAVWITYHADLPLAEVDALRQLAFINDRLLVSPYPDLEAPVVLTANSAWTPSTTPASWSSSPPTPANPPSPTPPARAASDRLGKARRRGGGERSRHPAPLIRHPSLRSG